MEHGKESPWSGTVLGVAALIALPFVLLAWLLVQTAMDNAERYRQMHQVIEGFRAGLDAIAPLESLRDLAPARVNLGERSVTAQYEHAHRDADTALAQYIATLQQNDNTVLHASADRLAESWQTLKVSDEISSTLLPFQNVDQVNDNVYAALNTMLFVTDMSAGRAVDANELLIQVVDTLRKARQQLGTIRAIAVYTAMRDGFISSSDAETLDNAWADLDGLQTALRTQQAGLYERLGGNDAKLSDLAPLRQYLDDSEQALILSSRIDLSWQQAWEQGERGMQSLRTASSDLVDTAALLVERDRREQLIGELLAGIGLIALYLLVTTLGVMFYRTRYAVMQARAENRAKGLFLARMSHEIRTPLNGVIGLAELLRETEPTPRQREYIELIASAGKSLVSLVNDILDHARIEAGKMELAQVPVDIRALIAESAQVFSLRAGQNRTLIFCLVEDDVPAQVTGDPIRLRQILLNLIANAVKFTERGRVEVCVERASGNDGSPRLRVEVRDTGIGLTPAEQQGLFNLFTQASPEVTRRFGGTGLGLSISRELVQLMGGSIGVYSGVVPGSVFWFEVPLAAAPAGAAEQPAPVNSGAGVPVLLVDPDGHLARAIAALPEDATRQVSVALNAFDIDRALELHPDLAFAVINGVKHPEDAFATARHLKSLRPEVHVRLLTAVGTEESATHAQLPAGVDEIMSRVVFTPEHLSRLLDPGFARPVSGDAGGETPHATPPTGIRVLVAEDNPVNQLVTRGMLRRLGVEADVVGDGQQALDSYVSAQGRYDLVLMDIDMPVMDGNSAARAIRRHEEALRLPRCPIVALSAHAMPEYGVMAREAGMDGQVIKPVTLAGLGDALRRHYRRRERGGPVDPGDFAI